MLKKGQKVRVKPFGRFRSIFANGESQQPKEYRFGGYTGVVDEHYTDCDTYLIKAYDKKRQGWGYQEHPISELEIT